MTSASVFLSFALCLLPFALAGQQSLTLKSGLVLDHSVRVQPGTYRLASASIDAPVLTIRGDNITVDLTGVTIEGGEPYANPDTYGGAGIFIDGGRGVTLRGGAIRGFKVGVLARRTPALHITGLDASYNWKQHLLSGIEHENAADWMSYHNNEKDEWLRYGAAIYLSECDGCEVDRSRAVQGQNGLMVTRSTKLKAWNNDFSYLSAVGLGLYRTTDSVIQHNKLDYDVRGFSNGFYYRGQDSTGILLFEQSSKNVVAYNSITHGGDGVFLWAGQSTMDTGQGGSNDNLFYGNDVSSAVANGIEATFSRNKFIKNRIDDCWHGIWGGYSFSSSIVRNSFAGNIEDIAIEHGQDIEIADNTFKGDDMAIRLWANATQDPSWGYAKARDTRSRDFVLSHNVFSGVKTALSVLRTTGVRVFTNTYENVATRLQKLDDASSVTQDSREADVWIDRVPPPIPGAMNAMLPDGARRGRATIIVDEWGPYDYRSPKLWPKASPSERPLTLRVLGPDGKWTLRSITGATASTRSGAVPGEIVVTPTARGVDFNVELEYVGGEVVTPRGQVIAAGKPARISYAMFEPAIDWAVKFWKFDAASDPLAHLDAFNAKLATAPMKTLTLPRLDYPNAKSFGEGMADHVALTADGSVDLAAGSYELSVTSDDGIKVWVDDRLVIEDWSIHASKEDHLPIAGGHHRLRIVYFQNTGSAELGVRLTRK